MIVTPVKTKLVRANSDKLFNILDEYLPPLSEDSVVVLSSKLAALCEGRVESLAKDREELQLREADYFLPAELSRYHHHFSVVNNTLVGGSGIDQSNSAGHFVLWPKNPQDTANQARKHLRSKYELKNLGVIVTDSISIPMRLGAIGAAIGYSGFVPVKDYRGKPDLFGREFKLERANLANGLAAAAVAAMGEGAEQTPLAIIKEVPGIEFCDNNPSEQELAEVNLSLENDIFEAFWKNAPWQKGGRKD